MSTIKVKSAFILRRDIAGNWKINNPILKSGEEGYEIDTGKRKVGDGITEWNSLAYTVDQTYNPESENAQSGTAVEQALKTVTVDLSNYYTKTEVDAQIGYIETALDNIILIQNSLIGGESV